MHTIFLKYDWLNLAIQNTAQPILLSVKEEWVMNIPLKLWAKEDHSSFFKKLELGIKEWNWIYWNQIGIIKGTINFV